METKVKSDTIDLIITDISSKKEVTMIRKSDKKDVGNFVINGEITDELSMEIFIEDEY